MLSVTKSKSPKPTSLKQTRLLFLRKVAVCPACRGPLLPVGDVDWTCEIPGHVGLVGCWVLADALMGRPGFEPPRESKDPDRPDPGQRVRNRVRMFHRQCRKLSPAERRAIIETREPE